MLMFRCHYGEISLHQPKGTALIFLSIMKCTQISFIVCACLHKLDKLIYMSMYSTYSMLVFIFVCINDRCYVNVIVQYKFKIVCNCMYNRYFSVLSYRVIAQVIELFQVFIWMKACERKLFLCLVVLARSGK